MHWRGAERVGMAAACACLCLRVIAQQTDAASIKNLAEEMHRAYADKDAARVLALWSEKAPERLEQQARLKRLFAAETGIEVRESTTAEPDVDGDHARLRVDRDLIAGPGTPASVARQAGKRFLILDWVRESSGWRIWKEQTTAEELAARLLALADERDRLSLLSQNNGLIGLDLVTAILKRGHASHLAGNLADALTIYQFAGVVAEQAGSVQARSNVLNDTGIVRYDRGEYPEALECYQKSLEISESAHDDVEVARTLGNLGLVYLDQGNYGLAGEMFEKGLALGQKIGEDGIVSFAFSHLASLYGKRGDYLRAFGYLRESADLAERAGDKRRLAFSLMNIGQIFEMQGDYQQAEEYYRQGLTLSEAQGLKAGAAYAFTNLGRVEQAESDISSAMDKYEKSLALARELGGKADIAEILALIGTAHAARGENAEAIESFRKSLAMREEIGGKSDVALTMAQTAAAHNRRGEYSEALKLTTEALSIAESLGLRETIWRAHLEAGNARRGLNDPANAESEFRQAIQTIEDMRFDVAGGESERATFFEDKLEPYYRMIDLLAATGRQAEAFAYAERFKARTLVDVLKFGQVQLSSALTEQERKRDQDLRSKLASLNARLMKASGPGGERGAVAPLAADLKKARLEYDSLQTSLYAAHPELKLQRGEVSTARAGDALGGLPDAGTAVVEYVVSSDKLFLFILAAPEGGQPNSGQLHVVTQMVNRKELTGKVEGFRRELAERALNFRAAARSLYGLLIAPASPYLRGKRRLILIPDGVLWELPFQALLAPSGKYVLDSYAISYVPSLTALQAMRQAKQHRMHASHKFQLLAMGNPAFTQQGERAKNAHRDESLAPLPLAETEVRRLEQIYGTSNSRVYVGRDALESRFKSEAPEARILHLATHGILNNASPLYSHLVLAAEKDSDGAEDGLLEGWEILNMKLKAELAVLSACETARGRIGKGEGVIGLSWALFVSGVPTTVISQWKVESDSTTKFMITFHEKLNGGSGEAAAIQAAARRVRSDSSYEHPFYWAPFIVVGASR